MCVRARARAHTNTNTYTARAYLRISFMHFVHIFTSIHIPAGVKYDSVLAERGVASQGAQSHNEYVVYDPAQVLPQSHIIYVYTNTHTHTISFAHAC